MKELVYHRFFLPGTDWFADELGVVDGEYRATLGEHRERVFRLTNALGPEVCRGEHDAVRVQLVFTKAPLQLERCQALLHGGVGLAVARQPDRPGPRCLF